MWSLNTNIPYIACLLIAYFKFSEGLGENVTISTKLGKITGKKFTVLNNTVDVLRFLNIPYARPPVGELRFAKPQPYGKWMGTLDATTYGPACIQQPEKGLPDHGFSENCLQLNIYWPKKKNLAGNLPVMVWIHGGAYVSGSGTWYDGLFLAAKGEVVVVTINYRLNIFGFFTFNNDIAKGNYGLWDQRLALQWVRSNIDDYGGNPEQVTIFGESAGGFSVGLLTLIPVNKGLFQRAIAESGVANSFLSFGKTNVTSILVADDSGCKFDPSTRNFRTVLQCLRTKTADELLQAEKKFENDTATSVHLFIRYGPAIDGELFTEAPAEIFRKRNSSAYDFFSSLDIMVGNCNMEGSILLATKPEVEEKYNFNISTGFPNKFVCNNVIPTLSEDFFQGNSKVSKAVCKEYGVMNNISEQSRQVLDMYTDLFFLAPAVSTLNAHANSKSNSSRYQYVFTEKSPRPFGPPRPSWYRGAGHASEVIFLFGIEYLYLFNITVSPEDFVLADKLKAYWSNFAKFGNPNMEGLPQWPEYDINGRQYLTLNAVKISSNSAYNAERISFWLDYIPSLLGKKTFIKTSGEAFRQ